MPRPKSKAALVSESVCPESPDGDDAPYPGEKERRRNKQTGTVVVIIDSTKSEGLFPTEHGRWLCLCLDHATAARFRSLADAKLWSPYPDAWCTACADLLPE